MSAVEQRAAAVPAYPCKAGRLAYHRGTRPGSDNWTSHECRTKGHERTVDISWPEHVGRLRHLVEELREQGWQEPRSGTPGLDALQDAACEQAPVYERQRVADMLRYEVGGVTAVDQPKSVQQIGREMESILDAMWGDLEAVEWDFDTDLGASYPPSMVPKPTDLEDDELWSRTANGTIDVV